MKHQRVKVEFGVDGVATDVSAANPLPISVISSVALTDTQLRAAVVPVSPNITRGAGIADINTQRVTLASDGPAVTALTSIDSKTRAAGQAVMTASSPVVIASNQSAIAVTGAFFQATQPVSGPATDAQLRATPLPVTM